ncbi:MAG TPA: hypothetical protein VM143_11390 [Acidimicrobiales bacterium]|nr:hypothetical protein [Acidimicrobiales bacterium]
MRALRTFLISAVLAVGLAGPAAAQTTSTTMPPVRSIPVTPAPGVTTTTARLTTATTTAPTPVETAAAPMADTGLAADKLVPLGLLLIAVGAALTEAARRARRPAYAFTI